VQSGEMTDSFRNFTKMAVVCEECYAKIKFHHSVGV
jgi:hypothetical protein